ncbi:hypothetical protein HDA43_006026 [Streptosporangium sandarakinum]|uniref:Uncharacterized protein n=1 Tax=Streptosporangium sandarakinum TaxID=1260955 RepID=A0A852V5P2_9ACTN|nr:hypothetical protein [Streptosporangium sandarakinum]
MSGFLLKVSLPEQFVAAGDGLLDPADTLSRKYGTH